MTTTNTGADAVAAAAGAHRLGRRRARSRAGASPPAPRSTTPTTRSSPTTTRELKARRVFSAGVPAELGGGGATHRELCAMLRELARHCGSTALALSMHTHLLAATVWRWRQGQPVEPLLERIAAEQLVLVSTGAVRLAGLERHAPSASTAATA